MSDLSRLLRPKSIAVIGGGAWGRSVVRNCLAIGFDGEIWPVHPKVAEIEGLATYPSIEALPGTPDAAYIAVNRHETIKAVAELSQMGCGGVVCLASGYLEAEAEDAESAGLQQDLLDAAGDMTLVGPNCYGFLNYLDGAAFWPDQHGGSPVESGVGIICQSSNMAINISMQRRGLPLGYIVTAGNQAQTGFSAIGAAMLDDPRVTALGLHIEGIDDIRGLEALSARARTLGKPIVALKVGKSEQARAATVSHTASLAGSDAGSSALLDRLGVARVDSLPVLLETLKLLHVCGPLASNRLASMSCSGGEASLMADSAVGRALEFPPLDGAQSDALRAALGPMVALSNPLDYHTYIWLNRQKISETFAAMMLGDLALGLAILDFPRQDRCLPNDWYDVTAGAIYAQQATGKPMAIVSTLHECLPESEALKLVNAGIVPLTGIDEALACIEAAVWLGQASKGHESVLLPGVDRASVLIPEAEAKRELAGHGLIIPRGVEANDGPSAARMSEEIGFPVVLKGLGHAHKTEAGAVRIGLESIEAVESGANEMTADGFLVEEMITGGCVELLVGVVRDPAHGFVLTLGAGGSLTEMLKDSVSMLLPVTGPEIDAGLSALRCAILLDGFRGGKRLERGPIIDAVLAVQSYVTENADKIDEIEINPLIVTPDRAVAADALLRRAIG